MKIVNPRMDFEPIDPRLVKYLQMRKNEEWIFTNFLQRFFVGITMELYGLKTNPKKLFGQISRWSQFVTKSWLKWCDFYGFKSCPTWHVASILSTLATAKLNKEYFSRQKISKVDKSICSWLFLLHSTFFNFISHSEAVENGESQS